MNCSSFRTARRSRMRSGQGGSALVPSRTASQAGICVPCIVFWWVTATATFEISENSTSSTSRQLVVAGSSGSAKPVLIV